MYFYVLKGKIDQRNLEKLTVYVPIFLINFSPPRSEYPVRLISSFPSHFSYPFPSPYPYKLSHPVIYVRRTFSWISPYFSLPPLSLVQNSSDSSVSSRDLELGVSSLSSKPDQHKPDHATWNREEFKNDFFLSLVIFLNNLFFTELLFLIWSFFRSWIHLIPVEIFFNSVIRQVGHLLYYYVWNFLCLQGICVKSSLVTEL